MWAQTGDTNRLKAFRLLTHPMHQRSSSEAGPGSGAQGSGGQSTVKLGDLASALQANNLYADKEVRHTDREAKEATMRAWDDRWRGRVVGRTA